MITDNFNRVHDYLRISLTDNCNLRCFYCMPDEEYEFSPASRLMQADEIEAIARTFVGLGVTKIRLTGGEPLVRKDAGRILSSLADLPVKLALTTNGTRIHEFIDILENNRLNSVNISLDTLDKDQFRFITRRDLFNRVMDNINLLIAKGYHVKVNVVVMKGMNDHEINNFIAWTKHTPVHVRFIEFMPFSGNKWTNNQVISLREILALIRSKHDFVPLENEKNATSKGFKIPGYAGTFAVISTMTSPFCDTCNRMRLTADGKLKSCLFSKTETDLLTPLRNGMDIVPLIHQNIQSKAKELGGQFTTALESFKAADITNRSMITIGG